MNDIKRWYLRNQVQITWFIIGWLSLDFLWALSKGDYVGALISGGLIWLNVALNK